MGLGRIFVSLVCGKIICGSGSLKISMNVLLLEISTLDKPKNLLNLENKMVVSGVWVSGCLSNSPHQKGRDEISVAVVPEAAV